MNRWVWRQTSPRSNHPGSPVPAVRIMGILNATPDSFSGDGCLDAGELVDRGLAMLDNGADILDIGGESSQPFAAPVDQEQEAARVLPLIRGLRKQTDAPLAIDTRHAQTAQAALDEGVDIINDITGLVDPEMGRLAAGSGASVVIMHMQGTPATMQKAPAYRDVVTEVAAFLEHRVETAIRAGIEPERIAVDPGICFGKTLEHNLELIRNLDRVRVADCPVVLGVSRKSMIGTILGVSVDHRLEGSLAATAVGICRGADVIRVHDVAATRRFLTVFLTVLGDRRI